MEDKFISLSLGIGTLAVITIVGYVALASFVNMDRANQGSDVLIGGVQQVGWLGVILSVLLLGLILYFISKSKLETQEEKQNGNN